MAVKYIKVVVLISLILEVVSAQRSPYAGSQVPNGYRDFLIQRPISPDNTVGVDLRGEQTITLRGTQRPPVSGVPVVLPQSTFAPIITQRPSLPRAPPRVNRISSVRRVQGISLAQARALAIGLRPTTTRSPIRQRIVFV